LGDFFADWFASGVCPAHAISPCAFGRIESSIHGGKNLIDSLAFEIGGQGYANADGDGQRIDTGLEKLLGNGGADIFRACGRALDITAIENDEKFLAAKAPNHVIGTDGVLKTPRQFFQNIATGIVTELVVDALEVVHVAKHDDGADLFTAGTMNFARE
jgi:hypothetical protein